MGYFDGYVGQKSYCDGLVTVESYTETAAHLNHKDTKGEYTCDPKGWGFKQHSDPQFTALNACFCNPWRKPDMHYDFSLPTGLDIDADSITLSGFSSGSYMSN